MRRKCTERFMQWKRDPRKKPLVLQGGRQTGKTWILRDFGEKNYDITIYINMETERSAADFLSVPREPEEILLFLESYANKPIRQEGTLLILDNFQCVAQGPSILGGLNLDFPGYHIAVIEKGGAPLAPPVKSMVFLESVREQPAGPQGSAAESVQLGLQCK